MMRVICTWSLGFVTDYRNGSSRGRDYHFGAYGWDYRKLICLVLYLLCYYTTECHVIKRTESLAAVRSKRSKDVIIPATGFHPHRDIHPSDPYMQVVLKPVPVTYFTMKLHQAKSYHDVLRIFYGEYMSNDMIDSMITSPSSHTVFGALTYGIAHSSTGGRSDDEAPFEVEQPNLEGTNDSPVDDRTCVSCDTSVIRAKRKDVIFRHSGGKTKSKKNHKKREKDKNGKRRKGKGKKRKRDLKRAMSHVNEMEQRKQCKHAVPELVRIRDISTAANRIYFPECTIVHRCKPVTGCCNETSVCGPKTTTEITRPFLALELEEATFVRPSRRFVETFPFVNHTECECKPLPQIPKCLDCPFPFYLRRDRTQCRCDCFDKDKNCLRIKRGRRPLSEKELRCIKEGNCHSPSCQFGHFNQKSIRTGYCPKRRRKKSLSNPYKDIDKTNPSKDTEKSYPSGYRDKASGEKPTSDAGGNHDHILKIGEGTLLQAEPDHRVQNREDDT